MKERKSVTFFTIIFRPHLLAVALLMAAALFVVGCGTSSTEPQATYRAEVQRTAYNVPHVIADNYKGLGYGLGYAYAEDNVCLLANTIITARGERSRFFGPTLTDATYPRTTWNNRDSDWWHKFYLDDTALRAGVAAMPAQMRDLVSGFVAGYNRYLRAVGPAGLPAECRNAAWVRPITDEDMHRLSWLASTIASGQAWGPAMVGAQPPVGKIAPAKIIPEDFDREIERMQMTGGDAPGSNMIAIGRDGSANGRGMLLGNPHFPWVGRERFYQMHLTIPGEIDVMGASLQGFPLVNIGFNRSVAWSHTVSTAQRYTLYELKLLSATSYEYDGQPRNMTAKTVTVDVLNPDSTITPQPRTFYSTHFGPVVVNPAIGVVWTTAAPLPRAYALRDVNANNFRMLEQWWRINRAASVAEVRTALTSVLGIPWVNTAAADAAGNAFYGDVGAIPYVSAAKRTACPAPSGASGGLFAAAGIILLNGSLPTCEWEIDPATRVAGLMPSVQLPILERADFVQNSNDSHWLTNPAQPLTGFSPIIGSEGASALNLRTRVGIAQAQARLAGTDGRLGTKFDLPTLQELVFANRVHAAEITLDDLPTVCQVTSAVPIGGGAAVDYSQACSVLTSWDRRANNDSVGMAVFREFWRAATASITTANLYSVPYNAATPINTPRGLNVTEPTLTALRVAMATAVSRLNANGFAVNSRWDMVHYATHGIVRIPIHGGSHAEGVYNQVSSASLGALGYRPITSGASYLQTVTFDATGPIAEGMLSYSQSSHPTSAYYSDQTIRYSQKQWSRLPFRQADIKADPAYRTQTITE